MSRICGILPPDPAGRVLITTIYRLNRRRYLLRTTQKEIRKCTNQ